jgi:FKBP-type peptidyl-prolyl cis-trans isomerase
MSSAPSQAAPKMGAKMSKGKAPKVRVLPGGLKVQDLKVGKGAVATPGKNVTVHYRGTLTNGKKFDASYDRNQPFTFALDAGQVIKGWDQGVKGMKVGGKRKLTIPAPLAYGANSPSPDIPANSTLVFTVELLGVS